MTPDAKRPHEAPGSASDRPRPTLSPAPASPWSDGLGRAAIRGAQTLLVLGVAVVVVMVLVELRLVVVPFLIATLLASAMSPLVRALSRRRVPRTVAAGLSLLVGMAALGTVAAVVVAGIRNEWDELTERASEGVVELEDLIFSGPLPIDEETVEQARSTVSEALSGEQARSGAVEGATLAAETIAGVFLTIVILYFLLKDGPRIWSFLLRPLRGDRLQRTRAVGERSVDVLGGYVRGTAVVATVDALIIGIALAVLGVPLALPWASSSSWAPSSRWSAPPSPASWRPWSHW